MNLWRWIKSLFAPSDEAIARYMRKKLEEVREIDKRPDVLDKVRKAVKTMPERQREILFDFMGGKGPARIAADRQLTVEVVMRELKAAHEAILEQADEQ